MRDLGTWRNDEGRYPTREENGKRDNFHFEGRGCFGLYNLVALEVYELGRGSSVRIWTRNIFLEEACHHRMSRVWLKYLTYLPTLWNVSRNIGLEVPPVRHPLS